MRIAIIGGSGRDTIEHNFKETLEHLGHEAKIFDDRSVMPPLPGKIKGLVYAYSLTNYQLSKKFFLKLYSKIQTFNPDLVIVMYRHAHPEFITALKAQNSNRPIVHVNPDHPGTLSRQYILMSPYDAYFTKEPFWAEIMRNQYGLNAYYLPESFNPRLHQKPECSKEQAEEKSGVDIAIAANLRPYRIKFLENVLGQFGDSLNIALYGDSAPKPWMRSWLWKYHTGKYITCQEKAAVFYGAKIVLNNMHPCEFQGVNCRFFEYMGAGGFVMTEYRPAIDALADADSEVVTFKSAQEAIEKIRYYLARPQQRWAIAEAGFQRAMRDHTYEKRIETIFSNLGIS
jgi:spore maturation protein CgeB